MQLMTPKASLSRGNLQMGGHLDAASCKKGVLLIDDDDSFCQLMHAVASAAGLRLSYAAALDELPSLGSLAEYDLIIVDYNLQSFTGLEIAEYVDAFFAHLPVMMVSIENLENSSDKRWPTCIRKFVNKAFGPFAIVQRALKTLEESEESGESRPGLPLQSPLRQAAADF